MGWKPDGYPSASPYLVVDGARDTIEFLAEVFGAKPLRLIPGDNGKLRHGEVRLDDSVLMVADALPGWPAHPAHVHVFVEDIDAVWRLALAEGAEAVQAPERKDDGDTRGGFRDRGGTTWWISSQGEGKA